MPRLAALSRSFALVPQPPDERLSEWQSRLALAIWLVGGLARLLYIEVLHPATQHVYSDMAGYVFRATQFAKGVPQNIADTIYPPGASIFFGLLYRLDPNWNLALVAQFLLSLGIMLLVWSLARRLHGNATALVALGLVALYFPLIHYAGLFLAENPFCFLMLLTLRLFLCAVDAPGPRRAVAWALLAGLSAGAAASFKTTIFGPVAITGLLYAALSIRYRQRHWPAVSAAILIGIAAFVVPMSLHCTRLMEGHFCLIATNGPMNILQGHYGEKFMFHWTDSARNYRFDFGSPTASLRGYTDSVSLPFGAYETSKNMQLVFDYVREHPGSALLQSFGNVGDLFTGRTIWPSPQLFNRDFGAIYQQLFWWLVLPPACLWLALCGRPLLRFADGSLRDWLLVGPILGLMALVFIAEGEVRYRVPFDSLILILAARGYLAVATALRERLAPARLPIVSRPDGGPAETLPTSPHGQ